MQISRYQDYFLLTRKYEIGYHMINVAEVRLNLDARTGAVRRPQTGGLFGITETGSYMTGANAPTYQHMEIERGYPTVTLGMEGTT